MTSDPSTPPFEPPAPNEAPSERWPRFSLKLLLAVMTAICVLAAAALHLELAAVLLMGLGLLVLLLVRDRWAATVVALYGMALIALMWPLVSLAFQQDPLDTVQLYTAWPFWLWFDVMLISQAALLVVPVAKANRRPLKRSRLWKPLLAGGLMAGLLVLGGSWSLFEFFSRKPMEDGGTQWGLLAGLITWGVWTAAFYLTSRGREPTNVVATQCRLLLAGSILELLVAVPTHVIARSRDYCCAGLMTFVGLTVGFAVMLFAFGPGLFFLFVARWKQVRPAAKPAIPLAARAADQERPEPK